MKDKIDFWSRPATIERNHFKFKSLSCWSYNIAVGCGHACRFCYVPQISTNRMAGKLAGYGVADPDAEWGDYLLLRPWDDRAFTASLDRAWKTPPAELNADGNRAVMLCTTTDPYQVIRHPDPARRRELSDHAAHLVRAALDRMIWPYDLNVRLLTRSPLARRDFDLMKQFGPRLLFGMSLPTLDNRLARVYEPKAPSPSARLETLRAARAAGLNVFVAMAPTYPECGEADLSATLAAIKTLDPVTVFHEPINIRADNVARIAAGAARDGVPLRTEVFATPQSWARYALDSLRTVERLAHDHGLGHCLHLWPDASLAKRLPEHRGFYEEYWSRVSEWPR